LKTIIIILTLGKYTPEDV